MENKKIHHANIVAGEADQKDFIFDILKNDLEFEIKNSPDFLLTEIESFGIDDARGLERWAIGKPVSGEIKVAVIISRSMTFEAQNALLKVFEEPPFGTYFFLGFSSLSNILPTLLSRVMILQSGGEAKSEKNSEKFLKSDMGSRMSIIRSLSKKEDKNIMRDLIKDLELVAYQNKQEPDKMKKILAAKAFAASRGSSPKMILEWLAAVI